MRIDTVTPKDIIQRLMDLASIPGVSISSLGSDGKIVATPIGITGKDTPQTAITPDTLFGAASLSKPVFAYLVLKLIRDNNNNSIQNRIGEFKHFPSSHSETKKNEFDLETPIYKVCPAILNKFVTSEDKEKAKYLTPRMILSHTTGLPVLCDINKLFFQFEPGTQYGYSGPSIALLQETVESLTGNKLQKLAEEHIFCKEALDMPHSSFIKNIKEVKGVQGVRATELSEKDIQAANSLSTTANDYAKFIRAWLHDPTLNFAFKPGKTGLSMEKAFLPVDWPIKDAQVTDVDLRHVSWGLGVGLQLDDKGEPISAYHTGDMGEWRSWLAINLKDKSAVVFFANSHNGHLLAEEIISSHIKLDHAYNFFFKRFGFARNIHQLAEEKGVEFDCGLRKYCLAPPAEFHTDALPHPSDSVTRKLSR